MGSYNQNQNASELQTITTHNTNNGNTIETERFNEKPYNQDFSQQDIINEKQQEGEPQHEENQQQSNQFILDRPVTVSDVLEGKITLPTPIPKKPTPTEPTESENNNKDKDSKVNKDNKDNKDSSEKKGRREIQRLSTTDSMQEFLEIPDYVPNDNNGGENEEGNEKEEEN